jgi:archaellum biogenesis ATPase FlaH
MNFEKLLIAGMLSDDKLANKISNAKFIKEDFDDPQMASLYSICQECLSLGNSSSSAVKTFIQNTSSIAGNEKLVLNKVIDDLGSVTLDLGEFSFNKLIKERKERRFKSMLKATAYNLLNGNGGPAMYQEHKKKLEAIMQDNLDIAIDDYYEAHADRDLSRLENVQRKDVFRFDLNLRHFSTYFPRGIAKQTGTIVEGSTGAGKSVFMANLIHLAAHPKNSLNCLYVYSENRTIEALSRLDAIFLDVEYNTLYNKNLEVSQRKFFIQGIEQEGYGKVFCLRAPLLHFNTSLIEAAITQLQEDGVTIDVLFIDSPDHMQPLEDQGVQWQNKAQVYSDLKDLYESKNLIFFGTRPQLESFSKSGELTIQSGAGGQGISRLIDNSIAFNYDPQADSVSDHRLFTITKARDGKIDWKRLRYKILPTLRFMHEEDFQTKFGEEFKEDDLFSTESEQS